MSEGFIYDCFSKLSPVTSKYLLKLRTVKELVTAFINMNYFFPLASRTETQTEREKVIKFI
ncbi:CLUMA_CG010424, isoform A [Clunio marinus]|uniref:CLUMA_CG010424, isoform A n=1 Tax=Clunio marinus TaxID=568069 RepID=A0A1J1I9N9_9DIPT|nr:CLUMA_CG010424, isoform A [Clunio marinus]